MVGPTAKVGVVVLLGCGLVRFASSLIGSTGINATHVVP